MTGVELHPLTLREDARGWVAMFSDPLPPMSGLHLPHLRPGTVRGNHLHPDAAEHLVVVHGVCRLVCADPTSGKVEEYRLTAPPALRVSLAPGIAHAVHNIGTDDLLLLCYHPQPAVGEGITTLRHPLIDLPA